MVTIQTEVAVESEGKKKFSFGRITKRFKFVKRPEQSTDKEKSPAKKKFSFGKLFRRKEKQPEVHFDSGYGEF